MILKIVSLFLVVIAVLGMFGKLRWILPWKSRLASDKCSNCGRHRIGKSPCPCGKT
jgi:hypothetical protein